MKRCLFIFLLAISAHGFAQKDTLISLPMQDGKVFYQKVYEDSATKDELFLRAKDVFLRSFTNTKSVIQDQDKEAGIISGKGYFNLKRTLIRCTIRILTKDNKYKVEIFDFYPVDITGNEGAIENNYAAAENNYAAAKKRPRAFKSWQEFNDRVLQLIEQIRSEMNKKYTDF